MSCRKEVVDFSVMTDKEILAHISTVSGNICGRVKDDQLNRFIQAPRKRKQYPFKYLWSVLITSFLISNESSGQIMPPKDTAVSLAVGQQIKGKTMIRMGGISNIRRAEEPVWQISGRVVDENNNPLSYASVTIKERKEGVATDTDGIFVLCARGNVDKIEIVISSVGFTTQTMMVAATGQIKSLRIEDRLVKIDIGDIPLVIAKTSMMGEVVVTAPEMLTRRMGGMVACVKYTAFDSVKSKLFGNEIKIYPNPIAVNSLFKINLNIEDYGDYALQFTDASGKIIAGRQINIIAKNQLESFNGNMFGSSGIYFVSIIAKQNARSYTAKLLVQ